MAGILSCVAAPSASEKAGLIRILLAWSVWVVTGVKLTGGAFCGRWAGSYQLISHGSLHIHLTPPVSLAPMSLASLTPHGEAVLLHVKTEKLTVTATV